MNGTLSPYNSEVAANESDALRLGQLSPSSSADLPLVDVRYDTVPMPARRPLVQPEDEEEIYTAFEAALNERLQAVSRHLKHGRDTLSFEIACFDDVTGELPLPDTDKLHSELHRATAPHTFYRSIWQPRLALLGFGLMCMLAGFDGMGLLMLHLH